MRTIISLKKGVAGDINRRFLTPIDFELCEGEHLAVIGLNGSGKSTLIQTITGQLFLREGTLSFNFGSNAHTYVSQNIRSVTFNDAYGTANADYYYQQRWNSQDSDRAPRVKDILSREKGADPTWQARLYDMLDIPAMLEKPIVALSSGELRKMHIAKLLLSTPRVLIFESPFIGLDAPSRQLLTTLLQRLITELPVQIILVVTDPQEIPPFITHVYEVEGMRCLPKCTLQEYHRKESLTVRSKGINAHAIQLPSIESTTPCTADEIVRFENISIRYDERTIINRLDWTIKNEEKWSLLGPNGSGKSTLLSLICADNPQAYSQNISLFGRKRGSGESIWEIKRHIGYLSPEMHRSYLVDIPAIKIVASGYYDTIGLFKKPTPEQEESCIDWLDTFGITALRDRSFVKLSSGEQRLLLLIRALVKNPDLLILDEPFHGLDILNKEKARAIIEKVADQPYKTIIYVTHYPEETPRCINKSLVLKHS
ncbi:MAG: ATP-binding cassette domain-containing protein [Porphyromonadaceae bacterium]|nr:ATP-binding cassette domain-containing protein [Porphyromonadaceae bacterium]